MSCVAEKFNELDLGVKRGNYASYLRTLTDSELITALQCRESIEESMEQLVVDDTYYFMDRVPDGEGEHFIKQGLTAVINFNVPLKVEYRSVTTLVHEGLLKLKTDEHGNSAICIPLDESTLLYMRGLFFIDDNFIDNFKETSLYDLVKDKKGCHAVSAFEVLHGFQSTPR